MGPLNDVVAASAVRVRGYLGKNTQIGEENTKAVLIEPTLQVLGWDTHDLDEVQREYRYKPQDNPVDYALLVSGRARLFVEAKALGLDLGQHKWRTQAVNYANTAGVEWCVLTDGNFWQVYKSNAPGDLEQKLFLETWLCSPDGRTPPYEPIYVLSLLAREKLAENEIETLWQVLNVDRKGRDGLLAMTREKDPSFIRLLSKRAGLTPREATDFLARAHIHVNLPPISSRALQVGDSPQAVPYSRPWPPSEARDRRTSVGMPPVGSSVGSPLSALPNDKQRRRPRRGASALKDAEQATVALYHDFAQRFQEMTARLGQTMVGLATAAFETYEQQVSAGYQPGAELRAWQQRLESGEEHLRPVAYQKRAVVALRGAVAPRFRKLAADHGMSLADLLSDVLLVYQSQLDVRR